ncbi:hypothetical protein C8J56DRAFT_499042 [Mycena floridula]|nr:hypothetical protein C8J56DRAFT_499042 [Mycena floridula]
MHSTVRVLEVSTNGEKAQGRPEHWVNEAGTAFENPWSSWRPHDWRDQLYIVFQHSKQCPAPPENIHALLPARKPTLSFNEEDSVKLKSTWLGHASFYVELPACSSAGGAAARGARILFDPIFSERCSPIQWAGFKRITPPACSLEELPEIDIIVIFRLSTNFP